MLKLRYLAPCREGLYFAGVLAFILTGAMLREINLLVVLAGMMAGPFLASLVMSVRNLRGLAFRRTVPNQVMAGEVVSVELVALNGRRYAAWSVLAYDRIERENETRDDLPGRAEVCFSHVPARGETSCVYRVRLHQRGRYRLGPLRVATRFPMSLLWAGGTAPVTSELIVCPPLAALSRKWHELASAHAQSGRHTQPWRGYAEGDFRGIRDWRGGDSRRWIHWRASARLDRLMVREFEQQRQNDLVVLLDLWQPANPTEAQHAQVEKAVSCAATLIDDACRRGVSQVVLAVAGAELEVRQGAASSHLAQQLLGWLALVEAGEHYSLERLREAAGTVRGNTRSVLLTTRQAEMAATPASPGDRNEASSAPSQPSETGTSGTALVARAGEPLVLSMADERLAEFFQWGNSP